MADPSGYIYAFIPAGILSLLYAIALFLPDREVAGDIVTYGSLGIIILSIILMSLQPRWLKPWWLKWLEDHCDMNTLEILLDEARKHTKDFERQTPDETTLAAWVNTVIAESREKFVMRRLKSIVRE